MDYFYTGNFQTRFQSLKTRDRGLVSWWEPGSYHVPQVSVVAKALPDLDTASDCPCNG